MIAIVADHLTKIYESGKKAVDNVSFALEPGEVFGFLGPNGAGKTTAVKLLSGMLAPTEGRSEVFGIDPALDPVAVHQFSGVVTEHAQMYNDLTGLQNLIFYGTVFGMNAADSRNRALALLERLELTDAQDRNLETYSTGMRQRLSLARALIHQPKLLFLDEPTSGLDPESVLSVNHLIKSLAKEDGATVFLCTHQLRYAQEICSSYGLIDDGHMLAVGSLEKLRSMVFPGLTVNIKSDRFPKDLPFAKADEHHHEIKVQSEAEIPAIVRRIVEEGGNIYEVSARRMSLEEIYFSLLENYKRGEGCQND